eukprot:jgi/Bigna1/137299/aug1.38_g12007
MRLVVKRAANNSDSRVLFGYEYKSKDFLPESMLVGFEDDKNNGDGKGGAGSRDDRNERYSQSRDRKTNSNRGF